MTIAKPSIEGTSDKWGDGRYRVYTIEHIPFDTLSPWNAGGPRMVTIDGWGVSKDGYKDVTLSVFRFDHMTRSSATPHPTLDGATYATFLDADRAAYEAGVLGFMVYERDAERFGLS